MGIPPNLLDGIERLDPLPATVQKLVFALNQEEVDLKEIAGFIEYDEAVASNVLRIANSAAYGGRFQVNSIRDAVVRLGTTVMLDIVLGGHLRSFKITNRLYDLKEDELWLHGATASLAVKAFMTEARNRIPPATAIAALIHDIGKLIMVRYLQADVSKVLALCDEKDLTFVEAEREIFGCDHAEVGGMMARKWCFPEQITRAIEHHHSVSHSGSGVMLNAVMLANLATKSLGVGLGAAGLNFHIDYASSCASVGLTIEGFERACAQTAFWIAELKQNYALKDSALR